MLIDRINTSPEEYYYSEEYKHIGEYTNEEINKFLDHIEEDILKHEEEYSDMYFCILKNHFDWKIIDAKSHKEYKEALEQKNRLEWLYKKNVKTRYEKQFYNAFFELDMVTDRKYLKLLRDIEYSYNEIQNYYRDILDQVE